MSGLLFKDKDDLIKFLDGLHDCDPSGAVSNRKWEPAQTAIRALKDDNVARYDALRAMHWDDKKLVVIEAKDVGLGVQTYSGAMLDDIIDKYRS